MSLLISFLLKYWRETGGIVWFACFPCSSMHFSSSPLYSERMLKCFVVHAAWWIIALTGWRVKVMFFLWVCSLTPTLPLSPALPLPLSICSKFTVYSNTAGCSEPLGMKSRLISDAQISASSSFRTWGIDSFTWHPQFARLDKHGKTNAWSPVHNNRSEWIQVSLNLALGYRGFKKGFYLNLLLLPRLIWRRRSASAASSLRGPKTSAWCSSCPFSKLCTVMMGSRGIRWRRRTSATIRSGFWTFS